MDNFNLNDVLSFQKLLQRLVSETIIIAAKGLKQELAGFASLLIFWTLILEVYPDVVISSVSCREMSKNCCEYTYDFAGTRITAHPVTMLYTYVTDKLALGETVTSTELLNLVTKSSLDSSTSTDSSTHVSTCPFISCKGRSILTFDIYGKISRWYLDMSV